MLKMRFLGLVSLSLMSGCLLDSTASMPPGPLADSSWEGSASGWTLTLHVSGDHISGADRVLVGTVATNRPDCFLPGDLNLKVSQNTLDGLSVSRGEVSDASSMTISGDLQEAQIAARFTMSARSDDPTQLEGTQALCNVESQEIVLVRQ